MEVDSGTVLQPVVFVRSLFRICQAKLGPELIQIGRDLEGPGSHCLSATCTRKKTDLLDWEQMEQQGGAVPFSQVLPTTSPSRSSALSAMAPVSSGTINLSIVRGLGKFSSF